VSGVRVNGLNTIIDPLGVFRYKNMMSSASAAEEQFLSKGRKDETQSMYNRFYILVINVFRNGARFIFKRANMRFFCTSKFLTPDTDT